VDWTGIQPAQDDLPVGPRPPEIGASPAGWMACLSLRTKRTVTPAGGGVSKSLHERSEQKTAITVSADATPTADTAATKYPQRAMFKGPEPQEPRR